MPPKSTNCEIEIKLKKNRGLCLTLEDLKGDHGVIDWRAAPSGFLGPSRNPSLPLATAADGAKERRAEEQMAEGARRASAPVAEQLRGGPADGRAALVPSVSRAVSDSRALSARCLSRATEEKSERSILRVRWSF